MSKNQVRRPTTNSQQGRLSQLFWLLANPAQMERRDPESVVGAWLGAVDGLQGRRSDSETAQNALAFLMRLESDPFYASPEQTRGGDKDSRGLVYSLALFLFERLTGHHPFVESLSPLECRIQQAKGRRVGTNNLCHLPGPLRRVLHHALSPFAEDRYQDIAEMRIDVERWLRGEHTLAQQSQERETAQPRPQHAATRPAAAPRRRPTTPPPIPSAPRRAFPPSDTLQDAITVREHTAPPAANSPAAPTPWLWPSISAGFALVATVAILMAVQVSSRSHSGAVASAAAAPATVPPALPAVAVAPAVAEAVTPALAPASASVAKVALEPSVAPIEVEQKTSEMQAVDVVRTCVPTAKLRGGLDLGISLLFTEEGHVTRSFTGRLPLPGSVVQCLKNGLANVTTMSDDERGHMMTYDLYVSVAGERTRSRRAKH